LNFEVLHHLFIELTAPSGVQDFNNIFAGYKHFNSSGDSMHATPSGASIQLFKLKYQTQTFTLIQPWNLATFQIYNQLSMAFLLPHAPYSMLLSSA